MRPTEHDKVVMSLTRLSHKRLCLSSWSLSVSPPSPFLNPPVLGKAGCRAVGADMGPQPQPQWRWEYGTSSRTCAPSLASAHTSALQDTLIPTKETLRPPFSFWSREVEGSRTVMIET